MLEKSINENEIINETNQKDMEKELLINKEEEINNKENNIDNYNNLKESANEDKNKEKNEITINDERKSSIMENINNISENVNNQTIQLNPFKEEKTNFNSENNLSKQEKEEQTENNLRSLLSELSNIKQKGNNFFNNKNYEGAEMMYKEGTKKINDFMLKENIKEINGQIKDYLMNINEINIQLYNNLSIALFKQQKYEESFKVAEYIIQNLNQEHVACYGRILYCLIELKKIILANNYADIIKKKFRNSDSFSKFKDQFNKLEIINKEFSDQILNKNPELKKEIISINNNIKIKNEVKEEEPENKVKKYMPYIIGGFAFLLIAGRYICKKCKEK